ncbi:carboxypeptidase-like regulatory domain-containing protein [Arthrobacter sp. OAP107]|jgi:hypothetical protein|uniref:carboxypeptidase-like regulatory domain-containing protein n=1 Tax=Arthrobacter sp. OAP107 TaxID=3156445 RepID=UPI0033944D01
MITLLEAGDGHLGTSRTDDDGRYAFPFPLAGRYVVTMLHPRTRVAMARKITVDTRSMRIDFGAPAVQGHSGKRREACAAPATI